MQHDQSSDEGKGNARNWWIVIFCASLFFLAMFWSIDRSIVYLISAVVSFSLFKIIQHRKTSRPDEAEASYRDSGPSYSRKDEKSYEQYRPNAFSIFIEDVKQLFRKDSSGTRTPQQSKVFVLLVAGFIGFMFFISIMGAIFGDENYDAGYYQRGLDYYNARQYDSAAYYYRLAIEGDPENAGLYYERGNAFIYNQKTDSALILYDQALSLDPTHKEAQYYKGYIYFDRKDYNQAIDEARKALENAPDYTDAMLLLGDSFYNQSQLDSAIHWYEGAYENGFRSAVLCHLMAYIYDLKGQQQIAIGLYKEAIGQDSTIVAIYSRLGELVPGEEGNWYRTKAASMKQ